MDMDAAMPLSPVQTKHAGHPILAVHRIKSGIPEGSLKTDPEVRQQATDSLASKILRRSNR